MLTAVELLARIQSERNNRPPDEPIGYAEMVERKMLYKRLERLVERAEEERLAHPEDYGQVDWGKYKY